MSSEAFPLVFCVLCVLLCPLAFCVLTAFFFRSPQAPNITICGLVSHGQPVPTALLSAES